MLFDSDVIVWLLRENDAAATLVDRTEDLAISIITYMEILRGVRDRRDMRTTKDMLAEYEFDILPLTEGLGHLAADYVERHALSLRLAITDALIAATAVEHGLVLCTANVRHYRAIKDLEIHSFRP